MNWYVADKEYINYLKKYDSRVGYVEYGERLKLHLGIVLELENVKYYVKGEIFSFGHQFHVYDRNDNEIGSVHEVIFSFPKRFEIVMNGATRGFITKQFTFFYQKYDVDFNGWEVDGDFLDWNYEVYFNGRPIIHINKNMAFVIIVEEVVRRHVKLLQE